MSYSPFGPPPDFRHLEPGDPLRAKLTTLRDAVAPILANNILHHFTDHSVRHSDNLVNLVDDLIEPLQQQQRRGVRLGPEELVVLYGACYLHDIGLQLENAGDTKVIKSLNLGSPWETLPENTRRDLMRRHHAAISAEMVHGSVRSDQPLINHQLMAEYQPDCLARVCEAHTLDVESPLYAKLMRVEPRVRMPVVSGLLRLADILDESRRRAVLAKARTLLLDSVSLAYWWRHYYTEDVTLVEKERCIEVWFDFPAPLFSVYREVVPKLQLPWIEAELQRHYRHFIPLGFGWWVHANERADDHGLVEEMPQAVPDTMRRMLREQSANTRPAEQGAIQEAAQHLLDARPYIDRRVNELQQRKNELSKPDYLTQLDQLSGELFELGAQLSAWTLLSHEFDQDGKALEPLQRLAVGIRLIRMMLADDASWQACLLSESLRDLADSLPDDEVRKRDFWIARAHAMNDHCAYKEAVQAYERAIALSSDSETKAKLQVELAEMHMLQGEWGPTEGLAK